MKEITLLDLSDLAEIKSTLLMTIFMLEAENGCTKADASADLREAVLKLIRLEEQLQESISAKSPLETKNRPNAVTLASTR